MIDLLGSLASILFVTASAFQAYKSVKEGHSNGVSHGLIWGLIIGFILMLTYLVFKVQDGILIANTIGQLSMVLVVAKYKYFPKESVDNGKEKK